MNTHRLYTITSNRRFLTYFVMPNIGFIIVALLTHATTLIPILNLINVALSVNVCVAFAPNVFAVMWADRDLDRADLLSIGIFISWMAIVLRTLLSVLWRYMGEVNWITNTDFTSYFLFMTASAATLHCLVPGALKENIPTERWIRIGFLVGIGVFFALLMLYFSDLQKVWKQIDRPVAAPASLIRLL